MRAAVERLAAGLGVEARIDERPSAKPSFTLCSERAITRWGYDPLEIGPLIDLYAADVLSWHRGDRSGTQRTIKTAIATIVDEERST